MEATKIVFLGSKPIGYACLQYLIESRSKLNIDIPAIRTRSRKEFDSTKNLEILAGQYQIPVLSSLDDIPECDIIYSVQHHELLLGKHLSKARKIAVNLHLAPLPEYRGCNQFSFAIMDEAQEFGATIHEINTKIDNGDILFQTRFPIPEKCWVNELYELTVSESLDLFKNTLEQLLNGEYQKTPQESLIEKYGSSLHFRSEIDKLKVIDLNASKKEIEKQIRATYMPGFEPPFCFIEGKKLYFQDP